MDNLDDIRKINERMTEAIQAVQKAALECGISFEELKAVLDQMAWREKQCSLTTFRSSMEWATRLIELAAVGKKKKNYDKFLPRPLGKQRRKK